MSDRPTVLFVHLVAVVLAVADGWYVFTQGSPLPIMDEWDLLAKTGDGHLTFGWMIQHHGEHRFPLPKLLWLTALRVTGYDFRAVMFVTLTLLVAASILLMWTARRVRGRQHPADALFPALLLHWGTGSTSSCPSSSVSRWWPTRWPAGCGARDGRRPSTPRGWWR